MRKMNFINEMIYCLYKHYKKDLFQAKMFFSLCVFLFFYPIAFFIGKFLKLDFTSQTYKPNYFTTLIYIAIPLFIVVKFLTINKDEIENISEDEEEIFRKDGKKYLFIFLSLAFIMWAIRGIIYAIYKT